MCIRVELINNRYRVIKIIEQNHLVISYLVNDMIRNHEPLCFNIINTNNVPKSLIDSIIHEFITFKGRNSSGIINLIQLGIINNIDNTKLKEYKYFYSTEYFERNNDILSLSEGISEERRLELFIEISQAVNTLHLKGCVYGGIKPSSIYINDILEIKIKFHLSLGYIQ